MIALFSRLKIASLVALIMRFVGPVPGAIAGHVNVPELVRCLVTSVMSGGVTVASLWAVGAQYPSYLSPADVPLAAATITFLGELFRRLGHGTAIAIPPRAASVFPPRLYSR